MTREALSRETRLFVGRSLALAAVYILALLLYAVLLADYPVAALMAWVVTVAVNVAYTSVVLRFSHFLHLPRLAMLAYASCAAFQPLLALANFVVGRQVLPKALQDIWLVLGLLPCIPFVGLLRASARLWLALLAVRGPGKPALPAVPDSLTQLGQAQLREVSAFAAKLIKAGLPPSDVVTKLSEKGLDRGSASFLAEYLFDLYPLELVKGGMKGMFFGALWLIGGIAVSAYTYLVAEPGGEFGIFLGACLYGANKLYRGYQHYRKGLASITIASMPDLSGNAPSIAFSTDDLARVGVDIVDRDSLMLRCRKCGAAWSVLSQPNGELPAGYWQCENGCNANNRQA